MSYPFEQSPHPLIISIQGLYLSDIQVCQPLASNEAETYVAAGPLDHHDPEFEPLREDSIPIALELPRTDFYRNDRCQQSDQRRSVVSNLSISRGVAIADGRSPFIVN